MTRAQRLRRQLKSIDKRFILVRDGVRCRYCGESDPWQLTVDHVMPLSRGGTNGSHNLVAACRRCNMAKGDRLP